MQVSRMIPKGTQWITTIPEMTSGWVVMFLDFHLMVFIFLSWLDSLGVALVSVSDFNSKYTWAPQTVHNTPVMNILKGYFYWILF